MSDGERISGRKVYQGRIIDVSLDRVRLPDGRQSELETIRHPGAAAVVAVDDEHQVLLVRQYRYATSGWLLEIPAGKLDSGESPEACARREMEEETGFRAGRLTSLGWIWTTPGFTDERIWLFLARDLTSGRQALEDHEVLRVERMPFVDAVELAARGEIVDAKSTCGLLRAARRSEIRHST